MHIITKIYHQLHPVNIAKTTETSNSMEEGKILKIKNILHDSVSKDGLILWKLSLLHHGISLSKKDFLQIKNEGYKIPFGVRTGTSGGLELTLPGGVAVNAPLVISDVRQDAIIGNYISGGELRIKDSRADNEIQASLSLAPKFYQKKTSSGKLMSTVGQLCFDRLGIGLGRCSFWDNPKTRCKFCVYNNNLAQEADHKSLEDILEVVSTAVSDSINPMHHILITGGTSTKKKYGVNFLNLVKELREVTHVPISLMMSPPRELSLLDELRKAGVSELSVNLEIYNDTYAKEIVPGKFFKIGRNLYIDCFVRAVNIFGRGRVRSLIIVGLEPEADTLDGVDFLTKLGVIPVLSPFQPMAGSDLASTPKFDISQILSIYRKASKVAKNNGLFLGPRCIPCQNNTISMPWDSPDYLQDLKMAII